MACLPILGRRTKIPNSQTLYRAFMLPGGDLGATTVEKQFPNGRATPLLLQLPSNNSLANKSFAIHQCGRVSTSANLTFIINLYFGLDPIISHNTLIWTAGPQQVNNKSSNFDLWLKLYWDSVSQTITGQGDGQVANNIVGPSTLINIPSADPNRDSNSFLQSGPTYGFTITGTFSGGGTNHAFIDELALESL